VRSEAPEGLLRKLAPQALGAVVRRHHDFAAAEDAVQEALLAAATTWPVDGEPERPLAWLIRVASRRLVDEYRRDDARRRREDLAASWSLARPEPASGQDDTLILMFLCCNPLLSPGAAIPLTLRAIGGLTTREIAAAFLVAEATMAQRISRAKAKVKAAAEPFALPAPATRTERLRSVLHVLYLLFNEGYASSAGPDLARPDLSGEAIRLARAAHAGLPGDSEVGGLLALMLLTDARRPARTRSDGELVPLAEQDRTQWDSALIAEGMDVLAGSGHAPAGEYAVQAAIAAAHDGAARYEDTDWAHIESLYAALEGMTANPMVTLNRAAAAAMIRGPRAGLALLEGLGGRLGDHHRLHAVRAHLLELAGDTAGAVAGYEAAASRTANAREKYYLTTKAAALRADRR
jgi:RNA polymerase sigma factor (sigma-70 family)